MTKTTDRSFHSAALFCAGVKNLRRRPVRTGLTVAGVALAVTVAVSLGGFMLGYRGAIDKSIDMLGFQVMIMAKGCPYEAATMMLKGGTGLLYLPADTYDKVKSDPEIESITPIFVGVAQKQGSCIRDDAGGTNFSVISGIDVPSYQVMKPWIGVEERPGIRQRPVVRAGQQRRSGARLRGRRVRAAKGRRHVLRVDHAGRPARRQSCTSSKWSASSTAPARRTMALCSCPSRSRASISDGPSS